MLSLTKKTKITAENQVITIFTQYQVLKTRLFFLLRTFIFWLALFLIAKVVFLIYQYPMSAQVAPSFWLRSLWHGLPMDVSMSAYIVLFFTLSMVGSTFFSGKHLVKTAVIFNTLFLSLFLCVVVIDLEIYRNWGFHLDTTPFQYLKTPKAAAASTPLPIYLLVLGIYAVWLFFSIVFYKRLILRSLKNARPVSFYFIPLFLILGGSLIIPIRGGFDVQPMNTSFVYYSSNIYANHVAVNPVWNFLYALSHIDNVDKNYDCLPLEEASERFDQMMKDEGQAPAVLHTSRPNVVLIILESFTSDLLAMPEVIPNLAKLTQEGLFFDHYHAVGIRSDKGLGAILAAYPAHPGDAVIKCQVSQGCL